MIPLYNLRDNAHHQEILAIQEFSYPALMEEWDTLYNAGKMEPTIYDEHLATYEYGAEIAHCRANGYHYAVISSEPTEGLFTLAHAPIRLRNGRGEPLEATPRIFYISCTKNVEIVNETFFERLRLLSEGHGEHAFGYKTQISPEQRQIIDSWYKNCDPEFTKRKFHIVDKSTKLADLGKYIKFPAFIKSASHKAGCVYAGVFNDAEDFSRKGFLFRDLIADLLVSEPMDIITDEHDKWPKKEWRCYVVNGQVHSLSRYIDEYAIEPPVECVSFCRRFVQRHQDIMPKSYILDIAETNDRGVCVIEVNQMDRAGRYAGNTVDYLDLLPLAINMAEPSASPSPASAAPRTAMDKVARSRAASLAY